jgi:hypothetical protein
LLDLSGDFFEVAEAEGLDHLGLHGRDVLVGLVGAERRANDRVTFSWLAPGITVCIPFSMPVGLPYTWAASRPAW